MYCSGSLCFSQSRSIREVTNYFPTTDWYDNDMRGFNCLSYFFIRKLGRPHKSRCVVMRNWGRQQCDFIYNKLCVDRRMMWGINSWTQTELWLSVGGSSVLVCLVRLATAVSFITVSKAQCPLVSVCLGHWFLVLLVQWKPVFTSEQKSKNIISTLSHSWEFISHDCNFISCYLTLYFTIAAWIFNLRRSSINK